MLRAIERHDTIEHEPAGTQIVESLHCGEVRVKIARMQS